MKRRLLPILGVAAILAVTGPVLLLAQDRVHIKRATPPPFSVDCDAVEGGPDDMVCQGNVVFTMTTLPKDKGAPSYRISGVAETMAYKSTGKDSRVATFKAGKQVTPKVTIEDLATHQKRELSGNTIEVTATATAGMKLAVRGGARMESDAENALFTGDALEATTDKDGAMTGIRALGNVNFTAVLPAKSEGDAPQRVTGKAGKATMSFVPDAANGVQRILYLEKGAGTATPSLVLTDMQTQEELYGLSGSPIEYNIDKQRGSAGKSVEQGVAR